MELQTNFAPLGGPTIWQDDEELECCTIVPEAPNIFTLSFISPSGCWFRYKPGQFLTLELPVPGGALWRTYTISSSPSRPLSISVTAKAQDDSIGTRWVFDNLQPGTRIRAERAVGHLHPLTPPAQQISFHLSRLGDHALLVDARLPLRPGINTDVVLVNCARRPSQIICRHQLKPMAARVPSIKLHFIVEEDDPFDVWSGYRGQFNLTLVSDPGPGR